MGAQQRVGRQHGDRDEAGGSQSNRPRRTRLTIASSPSRNNLPGQLDEIREKRLFLLRVLEMALEGWPGRDGDAACSPELAASPRRRTDGASQKMERRS